MSGSTQPGRHEFTASGPIDVQVRMPFGDLIVTAAEITDQQPSVLAIITPDNGADSPGTPTVTFDGQRLRVQTPGAGLFAWRRGRLRVRLTVPVDSTVTAHLGSTDLRTEGRLGALDLRTGSGDLIVGETGGDLTAESGSGDVRLGRIGGVLRAHSGSGDISVDEVSGDTVVDAASGDVQLGVVRGSLKAKTASGDIRVVAVFGQQAAIDAASGDVTVGVPAGTSVFLDLASMSGSTRSDLAPTGEPTGGAALTLRVHTMSGDIHVRRAA